MNYSFWMPILIVLIIIIGLYLGKKINCLFKIKNKYLKIIYWIIIYIVLISIIFTRNVFSIFILYSIILYVISDIIYFILKKLKLNKLKQILKKIYLNGFTVLLISLIILLYGLYNVNHIVVNNYDIKVNKQMNNSYKIVMISDIHLGTLKSNEYLNTMVKNVNKLNPDIFVLAGDIFDENTLNEEKNMFYKSLKKIKTKYGIYYVEGNHDLLNKKTKNNMKKSGINVLDDKIKLINNDFYLVGRLDYRRVTFGNGRKSLKQLYKKLDNSYPIILVDHQPVIEESKTDLQLSGHTHAGQFFPGNLFLKSGYYKNNNSKLIISSGYGAWSFAVRTAGHSEIVNINFHS